MGDRVPLLLTMKASMLFVSRSVTSRNWPLGLKANDEAPEVLVLRKVREWGMGWSCSIIARPETDYIAAAPGIEDVDEVSVLSYGVGFSALGELQIGERKVGAVDLKY
jgi:hypothetical protein